MQFSISNIAWQAQNDEEVYEYLANHFFTGLEIAPTRLFQNNPYDYADKAKKYAEKLCSTYNLRISSMQSIWYGKTEKIFGTNEERQILLDYTKQAILFAEALDCHNLVFGCPKNRNIENNQPIDIALSFFDEIGKFANEHNTIFALEANPTIYGTNFINSTQDAIQICRELKNPGVKVNYDLGTVIQNKEDINLCLNNLDLINHIHISEPYLEKIQKRSVHTDLIKELDNNFYDGYVSIEMKTQQNISDVFEIIDYIGGLL